MRILLSIQSLAMGGAEKFFVNLARALHEQHQVLCYIPALGCGDPQMIRQLGSVPVVSIPAFTPLGYKVFFKLHLMIQQRFPQLDVETSLHATRLRSLHRRHQFQVANTHLLSASRYTCVAFENTRLPITKSDHGDLVTVDPHQPGRHAILLRRLDALICPAEANLDRAKRYPWRSDLQLSKIPYGYGDRAQSPQPPPIRHDPTVVTFGLVARGVVDKGWLEAIAAARLVRDRHPNPLRLILVGEGPCIRQLRETLSPEDQTWITLAGQQDHPESWIRAFDVGLLPSYLAGESLPNTIIEYLACGKPVIATAIGGIPEMLGEAGLLVPLGTNGKADLPALAEAMASLLDQKNRTRLASNAPTAFAPYKMEACTQAYQSLFQSLTSAP